MRTCLHCGNERIRSEARFCHQCGAKLPNEQGIGPVEIPAAIFSTPDDAGRIRGGFGSIAERTRDFVGRAWVFQAIDSWLDDPAHSRFFLLTGDPGSGKSALAGRLMQFSEGVEAAPTNSVRLRPGFLSATHFCSARDRRWISPRAFAESLALQLSRRYPAYAKALAETSTDRQIHIEVAQHVQYLAGGQVTGVVINKLDVGSIAPEDAFIHVVREPLEALFRSGFKDEVIILVDALDESLLYSGEVGIVDLLSQAEDLPEGVRFMLTSRPDTCVVNAFLDAAGISLSVGTFKQQNERDLRAYIEAQLCSNETLSRRAAELTGQHSHDLIAALTAKADGNFLYARLLLDAIAKGQSLDELPEGLDGIYNESLRRSVRPADQRWLRVYAPLLGVLSVAQARLTLAQIEAFIDQPRETVWQALNSLQQFIEEVEPEGNHPGRAPGYQMYHQSMIDFLRRQYLNGKGQPRPNDYFLPADRWHRQIADFYWSAHHSDWCGCDAHMKSYGLNYLATHLSASGDSQRTQALINEAWMRMRYASSGYTYTGFLDDIARAWRMAVTQESGPARVLALIRLQTARQVVTQQVSLFTDTDLETLVWIGRAAEAIAHARLREQPEEKFDGLLAIFRALQAKEQPDDTLLEEAWQTARSINRPDELARALFDLAMVMDQTGDTRANMVFDQAFAIAWSVTATWPPDLFSAKLAQSGRYDQALELAQAIEDDSFRLMTLATLAVAMSEAGDPRADAVFSEAIEINATLPNYISGGSLYDYLIINDLTSARRYDQALALARSAAKADEQVLGLCRVASALGQAGDSRTRAVIDEALAIARSIKRDWGLDLARAIVSMRGKGGGEVGGGWRLEVSLADIAEALVDAGYYDEAHALIHSFRDPSKAERAMSKLAVALARTGQLRRAQTIAGAIQEVGMRAGTLCEIAYNLTEANLYDEALAIARAIQGDQRRDVQQRPFVLRHLAAAMARFGDQRASAVFEEALAAAAHTIQNSAERAQPVRKIAAVLTQAQYYDQALTIARAIHIAGVQASTLGDVAAALAQASDRRAIAVFDEALAIVDTLQDDEERARALRDLALALNRAGDQRANAVFDEALRVVAKDKKSMMLHLRVLPDLVDDLVQTSNLRSRAVSRLTKTATSVFDIPMPGYDRLVFALGSLWFALEQAGRHSEAQAIIFRLEDLPCNNNIAPRMQAIALARGERPDKALALARPIEDETWRGEALREVAASFARARRFDDAQALTDTIEDDEWLVAALADIAAALARVGDPQADLAFDDALTVARAIHNRLDQEDALKLVAVALANAGRCKQALALASSIGSDTSRHEALDTVAARLARDGCFAEALDALGPRKLDEFIQRLAEWAPCFEQIQPGISVAVLREALEVARWNRPDWGDIHDALVKAVSVQ